MPAKGKTFLTNAWKAHKRSTVLYQQKKKHKLVITSREDELAAMEAFIANKGVTICTPNQIPNQTAYNTPLKVMS